MWKRSLICAICLLLVGCGSKQTRASDFALNTAVSVTLLGNYDQSVADGAMALCHEYELIFSRTDPRSELYRLNSGEIDTVSDPLAEVIALGLHYGELSDGAFDITAGRLSNLWQFTAENPSVPGEAEIRSALAGVNYRSVRLSGNTVTMPEDTVIDLGGIAKGYIADRIADYLHEEGVASAIINLGGNVYCLGSKPDGKDFQVGLQYPYQQDNQTIATLSVHDLSVVTSGVYERYFEENGQIYHHILDTANGYPVENDLVAVTILSSHSADGDALSTACFALGLEEGMALIDSLPDIYAIFITEDLTLHPSAGLEDVWPLSET